MKKNETKQLDELNSLADKREKFSYIHNYSPDELVQIKDELSGQVISLQELEQQKRDAVEALNIQIKPLKKEVKEIASKIKQKGEMISEDCFIMFDHERNLAEYFSPITGDKVYSRPLQPDEMQMNLKFSQTTKGEN